MSATLLKELYPQDLLVREYLAPLGVTMKFRYVGLRINKDGGTSWLHDRWSVEVSRQHGEFDCDYSAGVGHRVLIPDGWCGSTLRVSIADELAKVRKNATSHIQYIPMQEVDLLNSQQLYTTLYGGHAHTTNAQRIAISNGLCFQAVPIPTEASVLHNLLLDSSASGASFDERCSDCGYDTDSRKAYQTYEACLKIARDMALVFDYAEREALQELLQDY